MSHYSSAAAYLRSPLAAMHAPAAMLQVALVKRFPGPGRLFLPFKKPKACSGRPQGSLSHDVECAERALRPRCCACFLALPGWPAGVAFLSMFRGSHTCLLRALGSRHLQTPSHGGPSQGSLASLQVEPCCGIAQYAASSALK